MQSDFDLILELYCFEKLFNFNLPLNLNANKPLLLSIPYFFDVGIFLSSSAILR
jgi:hypothetical protein